MPNLLKYILFGLVFNFFVNMINEWMLNSRENAFLTDAEWVEIG